MEGHVQVKPEDTVGIDNRFRMMQTIDCDNLGRVKKLLKLFLHLYVAIQVLDLLTFGRKMTAKLLYHITVECNQCSIGGCKGELSTMRTIRSMCLPLIGSRIWLLSMMVIPTNV